MRFLWAGGGDMRGMSPLFGVMTTRAHGGVVAGIKQGRTFAVDNECFTRGINGDRLFAHLNCLEGYKQNCLFVTVFDAVSNAERTLALWDEWATRPEFDGWPLAFALQNGQENYKIPSNARAVLVGGDDEWKVSEHSLKCVNEAMRRGTHVHFGRVNWWAKYESIIKIEGSQFFTCDGTRHKYENPERTAREWTRYMEIAKSLSRQGRFDF